MLEGIHDTAEWSNRKIRAIRDLLDETGARVRRELQGNRVS